MLRLTDTDGKPILFQEHYIVRICSFDPSAAPGMEFARRPQSLVVDASGALIPIVETVDDIEEKLTRGF